MARQEKVFVMDGATVLAYGGKKPVLGAGVFVAAGAHVIGDLEIGAESSVWFNTVVRADCHWIRIGARTNIQDNSVVHVTAETGPTTVGSDVTIGHNAIIHGCTIEDLCLIGMGAIVMDHAVIGRGSLVAAGALVPPGKKY